MVRIVTVKLSQLENDVDNQMYDLNTYLDRIVGELDSSKPCSIFAKPENFIRRMVGLLSAVYGSSS